MGNEVEQKLQESIKVNAEKAGRINTTADEALKYTQATLNAANALLTFWNAGRSIPKSIN